MLTTFGSGLAFKNDYINDVLLYGMMSLLRLSFVNDVFDHSTAKPADFHKRNSQLEVPEWLHSLVRKIYFFVVLQVIIHLLQYLKNNKSIVFSNTKKTKK